MFSLISGYLNYYLQQPTFKFLIIGEEKSGKSVNKKTGILFWMPVLKFSEGICFSLRFCTAYCCDC